MNRSRATKPSRQQTQVSPKPKHVLQAYHEGPLPSPETLRRYDDLVPGTAAIIVNSYQDEVQHRREIEKIQAQSDITHRDAISEDKAGTHTYWRAIYGVEPQKTQNQSKTDTAMIFKYFYNFD